MDWVNVGTAVGAALAALGGGQAVAWWRTRLAVARDECDTRHADLAAEMAALSARIDAVQEKVSEIREIVSSMRADIAWLRDISR